MFPHVVVTPLIFFVVAGMAAISISSFSYSWHQMWENKSGDGRLGEATGREQGGRGSARMGIKKVGRGSEMASPGRLFIF